MDEQQHMQCSSSFTGYLYGYRLARACYHAARPHLGRVTRAVMAAAVSLPSLRETAAEWQVVSRAFYQLSPITQHEVGSVYGLWQTGRTGLLPVRSSMRTHGTCLVYDYRPAACRMYGFYVSRTDHWWCADLQALVRSRALVMALSWAIMGLLSSRLQQCGEIKSLLE